ncbi:MAG TPA: ThuA domain-containing protein [Opitutaceae bacterium]|nr:ThuA domain-containing protein [Opitutaceae bacterium]
MKKVLVFTKSSGWEHDAIKTDGRTGHGFAFRVLEELGAKERIAFTFSKDGSLFAPAYLAQFDAFLFYTSGDLTTRHDSLGRGDDNPVMTAAGKAALLAAIAGGKGFVGVHSADDTFHGPGDDEDGPARHRANGEQADPYIKMLGGEFIRHDAQQRAHLIVVDGKFPGMSAVPADFAPLEEWYANKNFAPDLHVLQVLDTRGMTGPHYARPAYPVTWARLEGKGRVFNTCLGHREDIWTNPVFQSVLVGGLDWALRRVDADVTPNLAQVAPGANALPDYVAPAKKSEPAPSSGEKK